jgi:small-conductance mechanosensitive channel
LGVRFAALQRPRAVEDLMRSVLQASTRIVKDPPPAVALKAIDAIAIEAELQFRVASVDLATAAKNEIIDLIHNQCQASGLSLAVPAASLVFVPATTKDQYSALSAAARLSDPV